VPMERDILQRARNTPGGRRRRCGCGGLRRSITASTARERLLPRGEHDPGDDGDEPSPKAAKFDGMPFDDLVEEILSDARAVEVDDRVKAYHRTGSGRRGGAGRPSGKGEGPGGERDAPQARLRAAAWISAFLAAVVLAGAVSAWSYSRLTRSSLFSVRSIDMNPCANVNEGGGLVDRPGRGKRNIWTVPCAEVSARLASHPWIRSVSVRKSFPDLLVVRIEEQRPIAMVNLDALWYVNDEGKLFKRLTAYDPKNLAIVTASRWATSGRRTR